MNPVENPVTKHQMCSHPMAQYPVWGEAAINDPAFGTHSLSSGHLKLYPAHWHVWQSLREYPSWLSTSSCHRGGGREVGLLTSQSWVEGGKVSLLILTTWHHTGKHNSVTRHPSVRAVVAHVEPSLMPSPTCTLSPASGYSVSEFSRAYCKVLCRFLTLDLLILCSSQPFIAGLPTFVPDCSLPFTRHVTRWLRFCVCARLGGVLHMLFVIA